MNNKLKETMMENEVEETFWEGYEKWLDERAERESYERSLEI
jgi:antibiotic biosynthesis monooxygenase (ABM) superfamily enzyme